MNPVFVSLIIIAAARAQDTRVNCRVTVSPVPEGQPTEIVCEFSKDYLNTNKALYVEHNGEKVMTCTDNNGDYDCKPQSRSKLWYYMSGRLINGGVRLLIPHATKQHAGNYTCTGEELRPSSCVLIVTESRFNTSCSIKHRENDTDVIFFFNKNLHHVNATLFIYKQPFDSNENDILVLYCLIRDNGDPKCDKNVSSFDSTRMTLHINSTSAKDEGRYTAKVPSNSSGISTPCDLILPATISNKGRPCVPCTTTCPSYSAEPISSASPIADEPYAECADKDTTLGLLICLVVMVGVIFVYLLIRFGSLTYSKIKRGQRNGGGAGI